ncbi:MAG: hypothetical protein GXO74_11720 [Calditrichaeota bacterium]|nr:hypothetical protein [Calditrichota bacterium]
MSAVVIIFLAFVVIFWRAPFPLPATLKKPFRPTYLVALLFLLLLLLALDSDYRKFADNDQQLSSDQNTKVIEKSFSL